MYLRLLSQLQEAVQNVQTAQGIIKNKGNTQKTLLLLCKGMCLNSKVFSITHYYQNLSTRHIVNVRTFNSCQVLRHLSLPIRDDSNELHHESSFIL